MNLGSAIGMYRVFNEIIDTKEIDDLKNKFKESIIKCLNADNSIDSTLKKIVISCVSLDHTEILTLFESVLEKELDTFNKNSIKDTILTITKSVIGVNELSILENTLCDTFNSIDSIFLASLSEKQLIHKNGLKLDKLLKLNEGLNEMKSSLRFNQGFYEFPSINDSITQESYQDYLKFIKSRFAPFRVLPDFLFNELRHKGKRLFLAKERSEIIVADLDFYNFLLTDEGKDWHQFLSENGVYYLVDYKSGDFTKVSKSRRDCNICNYNNLKKTITLSNGNMPDLLLQNAQHLLDVGLYEDSGLILIELLEVARRDNMFMFEFISIFTLSRLSFLSSDVKVLLEKKEVNISYPLVGQFSTKSNITKEELLQINYLSNNFHIDKNRKIIEIYDDVDVLMNAYHDQNQYDNNILFKIEYLFHYSIGFLSHNYLWLDARYSNLIRQVDNLFGLFAKVCTFSNGLKRFNQITLGGFVAYCSNQQFNKITNRYRNLLSLFDLNEYLIEELKYFRRHKSFYGEYYEREQPMMCPFSERTNTQVLNNLTILKAIKEEDLKVEKLLRIFIGLGLNSTILNAHSKKKIRDLIVLKWDGFTEKFRNYYIKIEKRDECFKLKENLKPISLLDEADLPGLTLARLVRVFEKLTPVLKGASRGYVKIRLAERFDFFNCIVAIRKEIVSFEEYKGEIISHLHYLIRHHNNEEKRLVIGSEFEISSFISMGYQLSLDLNSTEYNLQTLKNPYFQWLINLKNFDYDDFDPLWVILRKDSCFYIEFAKHDKIIKKVSNYLIDNNVKELSKVYHKYLVDFQ